MKKSILLILSFLPVFAFADATQTAVAALTQTYVASSFTPTTTPTATPSITQTFTNSPTYTATPTDTVTLTSTITQSFTNSPTPTASPTATPTATRTASPTVTRTITRTFTVTPTATPSNTPNWTATPTASPSMTSTFTTTPTPFSKPFESQGKLVSDYRPDNCTDTAASIGTSWTLLTTTCKVQPCTALLAVPTAVPGPLSYWQAIGSATPVVPGVDLPAGKSILLPVRPGENVWLKTNSTPTTLSISAQTCTNF